MLDGNPWFVSADVAEALGISKSGLLYLRKVLDKSERCKLSRVDNSLTTLGLFKKQQGFISLISESGLYKTIMRSNKPLAKPFQDWVTKDVLPAIRKEKHPVTRIIL